MTRSAPNSPTVQQPARLALCPRDDTAGAVDGAWWPKTSSLSVELPDLVTVFSLWIGGVQRVVYDPKLWSDRPTRLIQRNSSVGLDPYRLVADDTIYLMGTHSRNAVLFVIPPKTVDDVARRVLRLVSNSTTAIAAGQLRRLAGATSVSADADVLP